MPADSYTFKVVLDGAEAQEQARKIRRSIEDELKKISSITKTEQARQTKATKTEGRLREIAAQREAAVAIEMAKKTRSQRVEQSRRYTIRQRAESEERKQIARAESKERIEKARQATIRLREEEKRRTIDHRAEVRERTRIDWQAMQQRQFEAARARYGGGRLAGVTAAWEVGRMQTAGLRSMGMQLENVGRSAMMTGTAVMGSMALAGKSFLDYSRTADRAGRALKLNRELTDELKDSTIDLSLQYGLFDPKEIAEGLFIWASGTGSVARNQEELNTILEQTIPIQQVAAMNQENLEMVTEHVGGAMHGFGLETQDTQRIVEVFNYTSDRTFATISDVGEALKFVGPSAKALGISLEETSATIGLLADANIKGTMAGRALRQFFIQLVRPTDKANEALNEALGLSGEIGDTWQDIAFPQGEFIGMAKFIDLLAGVTANYTEQERAAFLATIATANELPALTVLVDKQREARKQGINVITAERKVLEGTIDAEVRKYAEWKKATTGVTMSLEDAAASWKREWSDYEDSDVARADRMKQRWNVASMRVGQAFIEFTAPALEKVAEALEVITRYGAEHPELFQAALVGGGALAVLGGLTMLVGKGITLYADYKMIAAAATMLQASNNMLTAAGIQAGTATGGAGIRGLAQKGAGLAARVIIPLAGGEITSRALMGKGLLDLVNTSPEAQAAAREMGEMMAGATVEEIDAELARLQAEQQRVAGLQPLLPWHWEQFPEETMTAVGPSGMLFEEYKDKLASQIIALQQLQAETATSEHELWRLAEVEGKVTAATDGMGDSLMTIPESAGAMSGWTNEMKNALDAFGDYEDRRAEMIARHSEQISKAMADFERSQDKAYRTYLKNRQKQLAEIAKLEATSYQADEQAQARRQEMIDDFHKQQEERQAEHDKTMRRMREDHEDRLWDLVASRDARAILEEQRSYRKRVQRTEEDWRDENQQNQERLEEQLNDAREQWEAQRAQRLEQLRERLADFDANYQEQKAQRQADFDERLAEMYEQHAREMQEFDDAEREKLAALLGYQAETEEAQAESYKRRYIALMNFLDDEYTLRGEYVLNPATTAMLERGFGPLTQGRAAQGLGGARRVELGGRATIEITGNLGDQLTPGQKAQVTSIACDVLVQTLAA